MNKARRRALHVSITDGQGRPLRVRALAQWLVRVAPARARGELTIAFVSNARMRALNGKYRRKNYATDVLSFPGLGQNGLPSSVSSVVESFVGDIAICLPVARRQARAAGHTLEAELRILALHGLLHLLGYDHERDQGQMERLEARLRKKGSL